MMWMECFPRAAKRTEGCVSSFEQFLGPNDALRGRTPRVRMLLRYWRGCSTGVVTPHRPHIALQPNSVAERAVRKVLEGKRTVLIKSGLPHELWSEASHCYCFLRNSHDRVEPESRAPYELRYGCEYGGRLMPFGARIVIRQAGGEDEQLGHVEA